jgi:Protein tyrosine/serine phosphatase
MKRLKQPGQKNWKGTLAPATLCSLTLSAFSAVGCLAQGSDFGDVDINGTPPTLRGQMQPTLTPSASSKSSIDDPPDFDPNAQRTPLSRKEIKQAERKGSTRASAQPSDASSSNVRSSDAITNRVEAPSVNAEMLDMIAKQPLDLPNFFMVNRGLLRGGQPTAQGVRLLKAAGVRSVINLRTEDVLIQREKEIVEGSGIKFISMPTYLVEEPTPEQFKQFLAAVQNPANQPVYVHCQQGRDRTGTMIGAYRVACNGWKADAAFTEMYDKGFRPGFAPLMRGFYTFASKYDKSAKAPTGDFIARDLKTRLDRMRGKGQVTAIPATSPELGPQP